METGGTSFNEYERKMRGAGLSDAAIKAFRHSYQFLIAGQSGMIPESSIEPAHDLPRFEEVANRLSPEPSLLSQTVLLKLNGGLGTSMGLERAKSLLVAKNGWTFLDFIARQVLYLRQHHRAQLRFLLMNSFTTSRDTLEFLKKYPELGEPGSVQLMQSQVPKVDANTLRPVSWPNNPQLEWCPPGHGDVYSSLLGSGLLGRLLDEGVQYLFVSNSDNLGASLDLSLLRYFAESRKDFLMEVTERTASDRKGGHVAQRGGKLLLRESAQCPEEDQAYFQDIERHRFFNTNNLWLRLDSLKRLLERHHGLVPLQLIKNAKTVDPRDKASTPVFQLETAMGAAIECFDNAAAIVVARTRFAPVKTTSDLLVLRSDTYEVTADWRITPANQESAPTLDLDPEHYKLVDQLDEKLAEGVPSMKDCRELIVRGPVRFNAHNIFRGKVSVINKSRSARILPPGIYHDRSVEL
jgi:UDP-N-acetylglucosamine pyrophosphorylase